MKMQDEDHLQTLINDFDIWVNTFKEVMGNYLEKVIKQDVFAAQGPATTDTDPLNPRGINPRWKELSPITIQLKGSSAILFDTRQMVNYVKWRIEDSDFDDISNLLKIGWFEDSGNRAYIAAIHEFGLTGSYFRTPNAGVIMGGEPIGRTEAARKGIRGWFWNRLGLRVTGRVVIPERSMLRKAADMVVPHLDDMAWASLLRFIRELI